MKMDDTAEKRLLVIRLGALGDVATALRSAVALRESLAPIRIAWLVEETSHELVAAATVADEIFVFPRKRLAHLFARPWLWFKALAEACAFISRLRAFGGTCVLDFQGNLKSGLLGLLSGARDRIGFARGHCKELNWMFNNIWAIPSPGPLPRVRKFAALAQVLNPDLEPALVSLKQDSQAAVEGRKVTDTIPGSGPLVILHPGTSAFGEFKRWPVERFGELAAALQQGLDARCVITQGPGEEQLASAVAAASNGTAQAAPPLSITQLIELLRDANLVIAGDTGPLHIAALLQKPVIGIFGPKDPIIYGPYGTRSEIVRVDLECSPCTRRKCNDPQCITKIEVGQVLDAVKRVLELSD